MPEQLRIAMLSIHSCPLGKLGGRDTGGMNVYVSELAHELGKRGHYVDIYTRAHQPGHEWLVNLGENVRLLHLEAEDSDEMPKVALYAHLEKFICGIERFRAKGGLGYDLVHSHYWLSGMVGNQLKARWNVPHFAMFHTMGAVKNSFGIGEDETELRIESEREVVNNCDRIIAATDRERKELIRRYGAAGEKISVIPCGVNLDLFQPVDSELCRRKLGLDDRKSIILYVGRIERLKGLSQLLAALAHFDERDALYLIIVGGDEHSDNEVQLLRQKASQLGIKDRVTFLGRVPQEELPVYYSAADACVVPSFYESFGMVALESLACGTPVVATDVGGMKSVLRSEIMGRIARDNSPDCLAEAIRQVLSAKENTLADIKKRRSTIARYSWQRIVDMLLREYERVLASHPAGVNS